MRATRVFGIAALAAAALPGSVALGSSQGGGAVDIDAILNQMEQSFKNPQYAQMFASAALAQAAAALPSGARTPSPGELFAALESMQGVVPGMVSDAVKLVASVIANAKVSPEMGGAMSQAMSALHNSSVVSRLTGMINAMLDVLGEQYREGDLGRQTGSVDDEEGTTSSAPRAAGGTYLAAIAAVACTIPMLL
ncbi:hypothetical protein LPJ61_003677 [Coemansia biformis]|uniref:Uncharacterized protein n=1 Tax=Coemansia biformis TaxID=1286918 RepID=A0A9W7YAS2_9FUNG|nr:hypothetical protein LPJ61_003677 [Coemansia biformis]